MDKTWTFLCKVKQDQDRYVAYVKFEFENNSEFLFLFFCCRYFQCQLREIVSLYVRSIEGIMVLRVTDIILSEYFLCLLCLLIFKK